MLRLSLSELARMIRIWSTGLRAGDERGYVALAHALTTAQAMGLTAMAMRLDGGELERLTADARCAVLSTTDAVFDA